MTIKIKNGRPTCTRCGYEWSAMLGDNEIPKKCECEITDVYVTADQHIGSLPETKSLPDDMDAECVSLCEAINLIPGLKTTGSCCGHGERKFIVFFHVNEVLGLRNLPKLVYWIVPCHVGFRWHCEVKTDCAMSPVSFYLESEAKGKEAYEQAKIIAESIVTDFKTRK